ncbi:hypothetical protein ONA70_26355 [Micromonospora yasonensis]|uniref:hypothetical protein n=1 Tax=Micromonospora yasonensis TaxID=1128667 RepID=UPI00222EA8D3|nr:hypothetical protein [Micromonospora yasonensis]MCW3843631.1 hypothetical protein [Micromonospora yasonensis]
MLSLGASLARLWFMPESEQVPPIWDAGARLVADVAEVTGLTGLFGDVLAVLWQRQGGHDPGSKPATAATPDPHRQGHRLRPVPVPGLRHQTKPGCNSP